MSTQRETDAEAGKERFTPKPHEKGGDPAESSLSSIASDDDRMDRLTQLMGTDVCFGCGERLPCRVLESGLCRGCRS